MHLFYREYGEGTPLVILHGLLGISDNWVSFARRISEQGYRVIIPDQRNHGQSPHNRMFNYYSLTDDLAELIEELELEKPIILGHSMGGKVAMRYTLEHPSELSKLIVVDTSLRTYVRFDYHQRLIDAMLSVNFDEASSRGDVESKLEEKIKETRLRQFLLKNLFWKEKTRLGWRSNLAAIGENLDAMYDGVFYSAQYTGKALFIRGGRSDYIVDEDFPGIKANFPNALIKTIDDGTHWVHADEPEEFYEIVSDFLS